MVPCPACVAVSSLLLPGALSLISRSTSDRDRMVRPGRRDGLRRPNVGMRLCWGVLVQVGAAAWLGHPTTVLHAPSSAARRASTVSLRQPAVDNAAARAFTDVCWWAMLRSLGAQPCLLGKDVVIRESAGKGRGVFAARALPAGTFLTRYTGDLRTAADHQAICEAGPVSAYACDLGTGWVIDANDSPHSDWAHILNHSRRKQNCDFFLSGLPEGAARAAELLLPLPVPTDPYALWYETTRDIAAGEELCTDYGTGYWDRQVGARLHKAAPALGPLWRLNPTRLAIDYWL